MSGLADGITLMPTMGLLNRYFDKHLGFALGVAHIGSGVGQMVGPPLFVYLVDKCGLRGTLLIWAGIQLNLIVCALLTRPTSFYTKWQDRKERRAIVPIHIV